MAILTNAQPEVTLANTVTLTNKTLTAPTISDPTITGTTTNINTTNLVVEDKNIVINDVVSPSDVNADGGGISLNGLTTKTLTWVDATDAWTSSEHLNLASGKSYYVNGTLLKDVSETLTNKTLTSPTVNSPTVSFGTFDEPVFISPEERTTISATAAGTTVQFDIKTQGVLYYTTTSTGNWTLNVRGDASTTLNSLLTTGDALTVVFMATNVTAYYATALTIDGAAVTPKFQNGVAFAAGNANSVDVYTYTIIKTANATFTVLAGQTKFA
jgi:hypothetical protein